MNATNARYTRVPGSERVPSSERVPGSVPMGGRRVRGAAVGLRPRVLAAALAVRSRLLATDPVLGAGIALLVAMLVALCAWDAEIASRFSLTSDFALVRQGAALVSRGNLDPHLTVQQGDYDLWHAQAAILPASLLGALYALRPEATTILWFQTLATVGCEAVAFVWMNDVVQARVAGGRLGLGKARALLAVGLVLLLGDPWIVWAVTVDFHWEAFDLLLTLLTLRQLWRHRPSAWVFAALTVVSGTLGTTYLIGAALSCLLAGRRWWRSGVALLALGAAASLVISLLHAGQASGLIPYGYLFPGDPVATIRNTGVFSVLAALASHLGEAAKLLWSRRLSLLADVAVGGLVGIAWPWAFGVAIVVLLENGLPGPGSSGYALPGFQNLPELVLVPLGTVALLAALLARDSPGASALRRALVAALATLVVVNVGGWAVVWLPRLPSLWLHIDPPAAATLSRVSREVPAGAEVIVSQGVAGGFSARRLAYAVEAPGPIPVQAGDVWVVLTAAEGIETLPETSAWAVADELLRSGRARLVTDQNGVLALDWHPARGVHELDFPGQNGTIPAWPVAEAAGRAELTGSPGGAGVVTTGVPGVLAGGDYWHEVSAMLELSVTYRSSAPLELQVWDVSDGVELAEQTVPASSAVTTDSTTLAFAASTVPTAYDGWGPFSLDEPPPPPGDQLELRVYTASGLPARVVSLGLVVDG